MKNENGAPELIDLVGRGYGYILNNTGKVIAVLTAIVAVLVTFTDVSLAGLSGAGFTSSLLVMLIASYLIYFSMEDTGQRRGETSEEYMRAMERYRKIRARISPDSIAALREFCYRYAEKEADYRRKSYLAEQGYSAEQYDDYKHGKGAERTAMRIFRRAGRIRAARLTPSVLLSREKCVRGELESPERARRLGMLMRLIPSTLGSLFTVSVMLTAKNGLDAATVIEGILKLSALPMIGFKGYRAGYIYAVESKSAWIDTKSRILEAFIGEQA